MYCAYAKSRESVGGNIGDIDIMCYIALFVDIGADLLNICVSVGPRDATNIRKRHLLKNDAYMYLVKLLRRLDAIEELDVNWTIFKENLHIFDKQESEARPANRPPSPPEKKWNLRRLLLDSMPLKSSTEELDVNWTMFKENLHIFDK